MNGNPYRFPASLASLCGISVPPPTPTHHERIRPMSDGSQLRQRVSAESFIDSRDYRYSVSIFQVATADRCRGWPPPAFPDGQRGVRLPISDQTMWQTAVEIRSRPPSPRPPPRLKTKLTHTHTHTHKSCFFAANHKVHLASNCWDAAGGSPTPPLLGQ